jgi:hypothetical protein
MGIMAGGAETTQFEEIIYDYENNEILEKLYRSLNYDFDNEYDRKDRNRIEEAVFAIVKRYV